MNEPTEKQKIGRLGEDLAVKYLKDKGFTTICLNYRKKCGEIDIIAKNGEIIHFIEVKTVSHENIQQNTQLNVSRETDQYRPEDNVHPHKLRRLACTIQLYLFEKHSECTPEWVFDVVTVRLDKKNRNARVKLLPSIII